nr:class II fructose-bisphosphate aldolase [Clostridia bacterium]
SPLGLMGPMMVSAAKSAKVPVAVHLDHGLTRGCIREALVLGFTSVMFDGSLLSFEDNLAESSGICAQAHGYGATFEAELGVVGGNEGDTAEHKIKCTDPALAEEFAEKSGCDALAVAIGNAHGNYPVLPELRFDVLEKIDSATDCPLVLHGGTGITPAMFRKAISLGVRKINIATASFDALAAGAKKYCESVAAPDYFRLSEEMFLAVKDNIVRHINIFSSVA